MAYFCPGEGLPEPLDIYKCSAEKICVSVPELRYLHQILDKVIFYTLPAFQICLASWFWMLECDRPHAQHCQQTSWMCRFWHQPSGSTQRLPIICTIYQEPTGISQIRCMWNGTVDLTSNCEVLIECGLSVMHQSRNLSFRIKNTLATLHASENKKKRDDTYENVHFIEKWCGCALSTCTTRRVRAMSGCLLNFQVILISLSSILVVNKDTHMPTATAKANVAWSALRYGCDHDCALCYVQPSIQSTGNLSAHTKLLSMSNVDDCPSRCVFDLSMTS